MPLTPKKLAANNRYLADKYEIVSIKTRKIDRINDRLKLAAQRAGTSKREYILSTLLARLESDEKTCPTTTQNATTENGGA